MCTRPLGEVISPRGAFCKCDQAHAMSEAVPGGTAPRLALRRE